jgi:hypothetical protein
MTEAARPGQGSVPLRGLIVRPKLLINNGYSALFAHDNGASDQLAEITPDFQHGVSPRYLDQVAIACITHRMWTAIRSV